MFAMLEGGIVMSSVLEDNKEMKTIISYLKKLIKQNRV